MANYIPYVKAPQRSEADANAFAAGQTMTKAEYEAFKAQQAANACKVVFETVPAAPESFGEGIIDPRQEEIEVLEKQVTNCELLISRCEDELRQTTWTTSRMILFGINSRIEMHDRKMERLQNRINELKLEIAADKVQVAEEVPAVETKEVEFITPEVACKRYAATCKAVVALINERKTADKVRAITIGKELESLYRDQDFYYPLGYGIEANSIKNDDAIFQADLELSDEEWAERDAILADIASDSHEPIESYEDVMDR